MKQKKKFKGYDLDKCYKQIERASEILYHNFQMNGWIWGIDTIPSLSDIKHTIVGLIEGLKETEECGTGRIMVRRSTFGVEEPEIYLDLS